MENSNVFWNKIAEWFKDLGLPYRSEFEAMLILLVTFLILLFILWLVFRKMRLWYWKTNIQIDTLKSIDVRLHNVEEKLSLGAVRIVDHPEGETLVKDVAETSLEDLSKMKEPETQGRTAVGKSGKIYTEAELELQIRE